MDLSGYSNEELMRIAGSGGPGAIGGAVPLTRDGQLLDALNVPAQVNDLSGYSDEQLMQIAGSKSTAPTNSENPDSFLSEMGANFQHGIQSARDLQSGNFEDFGRTVSTPKTAALNEKLFPPGYEGGFMDAANNALRNTSPSDWSGALLEKLGNTPEGKALSVMTGVNPVWNAASTAFNRYAMPVFTAPKEQGGYGFAPENVQLTSMVASPLGLKGARQTPDLTLTLARKANTALGEASGSQALPKAPPAAEVRASASQKYQAADAAGGILKPNLTDTWINNASTVLPQTSAGKTILGKTAVSELVDRMQGLKGKSLTLAEAQEIYSALGDMASSHVDPLTGKLLAEGKKFSDIQDALWDVMENASPADIQGGKQGFELWKQGKTEWAKSMRMADMERIIQRANNADNPATVMKNGFNTMLANRKRMRGMSKEEVRAVKHAARHGILIGPLKFMGSRMISTMTGLGAGMFGGGPLGAAAGAVVGAAVGTVPRARANALQRGRAQKALNTVYHSSPRTRVIVNGKQLPIALPIPQQANPAAAPAAPPNAAQSAPATPSFAAPAKLKSRTAVPSSSGRPTTLYTFIKNNGGLKDDGGDIAAMGHHDLIRKGGRGIDEMGELLADYGYFNERPDINGVLDALLETNGGRKFIRPQDIERIVKAQERALARQQNDPAFVEHYANSIGIITANKSTTQLLKEIERFVKDDGGDIPF